MEMRLNEQKKHNLLLAENEEQIKQQRHDLRHQLTVISELSVHLTVPQKRSKFPTAVYA